MWLRALNFFLPHRCLICQDRVGDLPGLCSQCWGKTPFLTHSVCHCCGVPLGLSSLEEGTLCGSCLSKKPFYTQARAVFLYTDFSRSLVLPLKHSDQTYIAKYVAPWLQRAGADFWSQVDAIVPTPLHWTRMFLRQYNQATLMANSLSPLIRKPVWHALKRIRRTPPQGSLGPKRRHQNVAGSFACVEGYSVAGKGLVLLDDVLTSGATANACARVLKKAGARDVFVLTLTRTGLS